MATAPTQDFRQAQWRSYPMTQDGRQHTFQVERRSAGFAAVFAEAEYQGEDSPYYFSTNLRVVSAEKAAEESSGNAQ
jgi:hypothetical protein